MSKFTAQHGLLGGNRNLQNSVRIGEKTNMNKISVFPYSIKGNIIRIKREATH
jgi:hypothetical protein